MNQSDYVAPMDVFGFRPLMPVYKPPSVIPMKQPLMDLSIVLSGKITSLRYFGIIDELLFRLEDEETVWELRCPTMHFTQSAHVCDIKYFAQFHKNQPITIHFSYAGLGRVRIIITDMYGKEYISSPVKHLDCLVTQKIEE